MMSEPDPSKALDTRSLIIVARRSSCQDFRSGSQGKRIKILDSLFDKPFSIS